MAWGVPTVLAAQTRLPAEQGWALQQVPGGLPVSSSFVRRKQAVLGRSYTLPLLEGLAAHPPVPRPGPAGVGRKTRECPPHTPPRSQASPLSSTQCSD